RALREQGEAHVREMLAAREVLEKRRADAEAEARRLRDAGARDARALADARRMLEDARGQVGALQGRLDALEKERQVPRLSPAHVRSPSTASTQSQSEPPAPSPPSTSASAARKLSAQVSSLKAQLHAAQQRNDELLRDLAEACAEPRERVESSELAELARRHETALVLLGEKTERVAELEADVREIKMAYRAQLEALLEQR
ncbi:hypothetical protein LPJ73_008375, partial [Coemansia sp. RSA 2703]